MLFYALKFTIGLRVTAEEERMGLDLLEHGARGYNEEIYTADFVIETEEELEPIPVGSVN
jgi:Amt family ammonium transporter